MRVLAVLLLSLNALAYLAIGLWGIADPAGMLAPLGFDLAARDALIDARATYGGFMLAVAFLLAAGAVRARWRPAALWLLLAGSAGLGLGRAAGILVDGAPDNPILWSFLAVEAADVALAALCLARPARQQLARQQPGRQ